MKLICFLLILLVAGCDSKSASRIDSTIQLLKNCGEDVPLILEPLINQDNQVSGFQSTCIDKELGKKIQLVIDKNKK